jgi:hypothetical protein
LVAIYTAALSPVGGPTRSGAQRPPERSRGHATLHSSAARDFALAMAFSYRGLCEC